MGYLSIFSKKVEAIFYINYVTVLKTSFNYEVPARKNVILEVR